GSRVHRRERSSRLPRDPTPPRAATGLRPRDPPPPTASRPFQPGTRSRGRWSWVLGEPPGLFLLHECIGDLVEFTGQDLVELVQRQADPVIGYAILLEVVGADLLRTPSTAGLVPAGLGSLRRL